MVTSDTVVISANSSKFFKISYKLITSNIEKNATNKLKELLNEKTDIPGASIQVNQITYNIEIQFFNPQKNEKSKAIESFTKRTSFGFMTSYK